MRRRLLLLSLGTAVFGLMVGCGAGFVASLPSMYGSWTDGTNFMSVHAPGSQTRQTGDQLEIYYPSTGGGSDWPPSASTRATYGRCHR